MERELWRKQKLVQNLVFWRNEHNPKQLFAKLKQWNLLEEIQVYWTSEKEHKVDALAPRADEGRDYLRKATVSWK